MPRVRLTPTPDEILDDRLSDLSRRIFGPPDQRCNLARMSQRTKIPHTTLLRARKDLGKTTARNLMILIMDRKLSAEELKTYLR